MGTAQSIRSCRVRAGKSQAEVAAHLRLNPAWYQDLERRDEALPTTLTLFQAIELAACLGVRPHELLGLAPCREEPISILELPARIDAHLARTGTSVARFEVQSGREVCDFLRAPLQTAAELPLAFFMDIARHIGIDWLALVPEAGAE